MIFVIDDSKTILLGLKKILTLAGYKVELAENGKNAISKINDLKKQNIKPQLIICDLHMPVMDGMIFLKHLKNDDELKNIPTLILTVESDIDIIQEAKELGASGWILKPIKENMLLDMIKKFSIKDK